VSIMGKRWRGYKPKRGKIKTKKELKRIRLRRFAADLNNNLPRSEKWFQALYKPHKHIDDKFNEPVISRYIGDVVNKSFMYVIEIDGSIHELEEIRRKDLAKEINLRSHGYHVFRIKHNDLAGFNRALEKILRIREVDKYALDYTQTIPKKELSTRELKRIHQQRINIETEKAMKRQDDNRKQFQALKKQKFEKNFKYNTKIRKWVRIRE
jgi:very-short-patch-repair endonuclease